MHAFFFAFCSSFYSYVIVRRWLFKSLTRISLLVKTEGRCDACDAKHPNDAAYTHQISPLGEYAKLGNIVYVGYDEDVRMV